MDFLPCAGDFSAHISCHPRLRPRSSCKISTPVVQNSSSKTILYVALYSKPHNIFIKASWSRAISRPWNKFPAHYSKFPIWPRLKSLFSARGRYFSPSNLCALKNRPCIISPYEKVYFYSISFKFCALDWRAARMAVCLRAEDLRRAPGSEVCPSSAHLTLCFTK